MVRLIGREASGSKISNLSSSSAAVASEASLRDAADAHGSSGSGGNAIEDVSRRGSRTPTGSKLVSSRRPSWLDRARPASPESEGQLTGVNSTLSLVKELPSEMSDQPLALTSGSRAASRSGSQLEPYRSTDSRLPSRTSGAPHWSSESTGRISFPSTGSERPAIDYDSALFNRGRVFHEMQSEDAELLEIDVIDANRTGIIPCLSFVVTWVVSAAGVLFAFVWVYAFQEVLRVETLARNLGADHARLHIGEVLSPAVAVVGAVQTAYRSGSLTSLSGYANITRLLAPHFAACASLREVELIAAPGAKDLDGVPLGSGSVLVMPSWSGALELRTDRADCVAAPLPAGCAAEPMRTEESAWYRRGFGVGMEWWYKPPSQLWYGPSFLHDLPHEADCEELCWSPTYAFVARVAAGRVPLEQAAGQVADLGAADEDEESMEAITSTVTTTTSTSTPLPPLPSVLVRAAINAGELQKVAAAVEEIARAEVFICTDKNELVAASDMADVMYVDDATGILRPAFVSELARPWVIEQVGEEESLGDFVRKARDDRSFEAGGYRVSSHILAGSTSGTASLGVVLRLIIAVPGSSFIDSALGAVVMPALAASATPFAVVFLLTALAAYLKFCVRSQSLQISPFTRLS